MNIPFLDLQKQYSQIRHEIHDAIERVIKKQIFILGEELEHFEREYANYLGVKYVLGVGSGTDALILSLRACGIGKGDEVITQPNSFIATTLAITEIGATPIFVDVNPQTFQIDEKKIENRITTRTKAILPVHLYGAPCQIDEMVIIAKKHKLFLVEDACQSHSANLNGKKTGTFGDIGAFSFYPGKNLGAYGDGGAIATNNFSLYRSLLQLRNYGQLKKYYHSSIGLNSRLDELQAAILRVKLKHLDKWSFERNLVAKKYKRELQGILQYQEVIRTGFSNYHIFAIVTDNRNSVMEQLKRENIQALIHYPVPIHLQKCYEYLGYNKGDFPITENLSHHLLSLPMYPELKSSSVRSIVQTILMALKKD